MPVHDCELEHALLREPRTRALLLGALTARGAVAANEVASEAVSTGLPVGVGVVRYGLHR